tara:strand:- start:19 stop:1161 length:1143 start_codon:yes stop_codon:yes gene_type:complete
MRYKKIDMGTETINRLNGRKSLSALLIALAMLVVVTAGSASAETANVQAFENEKLTLEVIKQVEEDYAISEEMRSDELLDSSGFNLDDAEDMDQDGNNVVVLVWTDGEVAWVVVVVINDDGSYDINKIGRMSVEDLRERLANFDGRVIIHYIGDESDPQPLCAHGYLAARWSLLDDVTSAADGQFQGVWMDDEGYIGGNISGFFADGEFRGVATNLDDENVGRLKGTYANGLYRGVWESMDGDHTGVLGGKYRATADEQGVMKGKWKENCDDGVSILPVPADPTHIDGRDNVTGLDDSSDRVKPLPKPMPLPDNEPVKPKPKPTDSGLEKIQKDADDLLETKIIETDGGVSVDVGDAAAGGAISSIPMLGLGLLRRRFLL